MGDYMVRATGGECTGARVCSDNKGACGDSETGTNTSPADCF